MDITATPTPRWRQAPLIALRGFWAGASWRALMHLVTGSIIGLLSGFILIILAMAAVAGALTVIIPLGAGAAIFALSGALTLVQRSRHTAFLGAEWPDTAPLRPVTLAPKALLEVLRRPRTWRHLSYHAITAVYSPIAAFFAIGAWTAGPMMMAAPLMGLRSGLETRHWWLLGVGVLVLIGAPWLGRGLAEIDSLLARALLGTSRTETLEARVSDLAASRESTVDAADAERRRIERDLHDGAQQRLTSLAMNLGIARATLTDLPEGGAKALEEAHEEAKQVLTDLRDLVRGLHPAVLEDRGLDAALSAVAARSPVPTRLRVDMDRRVARDIEAVAYFVVSEALTNAAKHSRAKSATVDITISGSRLLLRVTDDGRGGADPERGTGLQGLADRVRSVEGTFHLSSPLGGPTTIEAELPCAS
ncbi:sensor histidine kinase [Glycomyces sp. NPDC046736]|uniref:sensor histidine kinase n=1 Tax=Glycomyces sp. NPDC046736 TaxID=3155615 RepID=UPI003407858F